MQVRTALLGADNHVRLATVELPADCRGLLVRVLYAGICGTDLHLIAGHDSKPRPISIGHEFIGEVVECGPEPSTGGVAVGVGDRVVIEPGFSCGTCVYCRRHGALTNLCPARRCHGLEALMDDAPLLGGMSEHVRLAPAARVHPIGRLSTVRAALAEPLSVAVRAAERALGSSRPDINLGPGLGACAVVVGLGPIGLSVALILTRMGATVTGIDIEEQRVRLACSLGVDAYVDGPGERAVETGLPPWGSDVVVECAGHPSAFLRSLSLVRRGGRVVVLGHFYPAGSVAFDPSSICRNDLEVVGCALGPREAYEKAMRLLEDEAMPWDRIVTDTFPLDRVADAFEVAQDRQRGKVLVGSGQ